MSWTRGAPDPTTAMVWQVRPAEGENRPIGLVNRIDAGVWEITYPMVAAFPLTDDSPEWDRWEHAPVNERDGAGRVRPPARRDHDLQPSLERACGARPRPRPQQADRALQAAVHPHLQADEGRLVTDILDLVYHEALLRRAPGDMSALRTDVDLRSAILLTLVEKLPKLELDDETREGFMERMQELGAGNEGPSKFMAKVMSIPAAAAMYLAFKHWDLGAPVYVIGPRLRAMFERTNLGAVREEDFHLPYSTLYLALPECELTVWGGKARHRLIGAFVHRANFQVLADDGTTSEGLYLILVGEDLSPPGDFGDDALRTMPIRLDVPIEPQIGRKSFYNASHPDDDNLLLDRESMSLAVRVVVNALMYLGAEMPSEETEESKQRLKKRKRLMGRTGKKAGKSHRIAARTSPLSVVWLGRDAETAAQGGTHESPQEHWVKGHWHPYWYGPGRKLRRVNWVKPFLRGDPQRGRVETRIYQMEEPDGS